MEGRSNVPRASLPPPPFQVAAKKDNARLRQEVTHLKDEGAALAADAAAARNASAAQAAALERSTRRASMAGQAAGAGGGEDSLDEATAQVLRSVAAERAGAAGGSALASSDEARYKDVITRLTRILDAERRATRAVRLAARRLPRARPHPPVSASTAAPLCRLDSSSPPSSLHALKRRCFCARRSRRRARTSTASGRRSSRRRRARSGPARPSLRAARRAWLLRARRRWVGGAARCGAAAAPAGATGACYLPHPSMRR